MSGDCPHRLQLDHMLLEYKKKTDLLTSTHTDYLQIIEELKNELDTLSCQVTDILENSPKTTRVESKESGKTKNNEASTSLDTCTTSQDFDTKLMGTLSELEHQNELLQSALVRATRNREDYLLELEEKSEYFKNHLDTMRNALTEKDTIIAKQNVVIARLLSPQNCVDENSIKNVSLQLESAVSRIENLENELDRSRNSEQLQVRESRQLSDKLTKIKSNNVELLTQIERLRSLLKETTQNYECLQEKYEKLNKASEHKSKDIQCLERKVAELQTKFTEDTMETKLLQHQLTTLRQKEAITSGELKASQNRYLKIDGELSMANDMVKKLRSILHDKEEQYLKSIKRQQEVNVELENNIKLAASQLEKLRQEYDDLSAVSKQQAETIVSYNKWKIEQRKADAKTKESFEKYEKYVKLLTEQSKSCLDRCRSLHESNQMLTDEIKRLRAITLSIRPGVLSPMTSGSNEMITSRFDRLRLTTQRVIQQQMQLKSDVSTNYVSNDDLISSPSKRESYSVQEEERTSIINPPNLQNSRGDFVRTDKNQSTENKENKAT